jgi:CheY-like chemotaxis protein
VRRVSEFFAAIDTAWVADGAQKVRLSIIGCGALMLQTDYERGTKDSDIFETTVRPNDKADIDEMIRRGLVAHELLVERFRSAAGMWADGALADQLPRYDEPSVARLVGRILSEYEVTIVHDGQSLVELCRRETFDLIICDLMMPKLTGMDAYAELLRAAPNLARRMLFMTGGTFTESAQRFLENEAPNWVAKPIGAKELRKHVDRLLSLPNGST